MQPSTYTSSRHLRPLGFFVTGLGLLASFAASADTLTIEADLTVQNELAVGVSSNVNAPAVDTHFKVEDNGVIWAGSGTGFDDNNQIPIGEGSRLMWMPTKSAFRIVSSLDDVDFEDLGYATTAWGGGETTGNYSTAWGGGSAYVSYSTAWGGGYAGSAEWGFGEYATAWGGAFSGDAYTTAWGGADTVAIGYYSTAWGGGTTTYDYATAWGRAVAGDFNATAWGGVDTLAAGPWTTAWGGGVAYGSYSTAWGGGFTGVRGAGVPYYQALHPNYATAWGGAVAMGHYATAWSGGEANGEYSTAVGYKVLSDSYASTAFGAVNIGGVDSANNGETTWVSTDPLLEIGNGYYVLDMYQYAQNALTILKNGRIALGTHSSMTALKNQPETVQIQGPILIGDYSGSVNLDSDATAGAIRYDSTAEDFMAAVSVDAGVVTWKSLTSGGTGSTLVDPETPGNAAITVANGGDITVNGAMNITGTIAMATAQGDISMGAFTATAQ